MAQFFTAEIPGKTGLSGTRFKTIVGLVHARDTHQEVENFIKLQFKEVRNIKGQ